MMMKVVGLETEPWEHEAFEEGIPDLLNGQGLFVKDGAASKQGSPTHIPGG
jgi:hypothetical protein